MLLALLLHVEAGASSSSFLLLKTAEASASMSSSSTVMLASLLPSWLFLLVTFAVPICSGNWGYYVSSVRVQERVDVGQEVSKFVGVEGLKSYRWLASSSRGAFIMIEVSFI